VSLVRKRVLVAGQVQGVGFRAGCRREALAAGVSGWVRNRSDGTVEAAFEGDEAAVARVVSWCRQGPPWGDVDHVTVEDEMPTGERGFAAR
jgi:acylphosphatase